MSFKIKYEKTTEYDKHPYIFKKNSYIWYIEDETLIAILQVVKPLDEDLRRKILTIITLRKKFVEELYELHYNFSDEINDMNTSDYYFSK